MAKLHKVEMYILDIDEQYGSLQDTIDHINDRLELVSLHPFNIKTVEFDLSDGHKLNKCDVGYEDYKGMFNNYEDNIDDGKQESKSTLATESVEYDECDEELVGEEYDEYRVVKARKVCCSDCRYSDEKCKINKLKKFNQCSDCICYICSGGCGSGSFMRHKSLLPKYDKK